jgi:hypothetical protein
MNITYDQVESIRGSLNQVGAKSDVLFYAFHTRLSMAAPTMRLVITGDLRERGEALYQLLISAADNAYNRPLLASTVWAFNEWLTGYSTVRVKDKAVKEALMWALGRVLGAKCSRWCCWHGAICSVRCARSIRN